MSVRRPEGPDGPFELRIVPKRELPAGWLAMDVLLKPQSPGGQPLPVTAIPIKGYVREGVEALPASLMLGFRPVGQTVDDTIVLRSANGKPFVALDGRSESSDLTLEPLADGGSYAKTFRVRQRIVRAGKQEAALRFRVRHPEEAEILTITVPVVYHGSNPDVDSAGGLDHVSKSAPVVHTSP